MSRKDKNVSHDAASIAHPRFRLLDTPAETAQAAQLIAKVWGSQPGAYPLSAATLRAFSYTGNYVAAAYIDDEMVGCAAGFFAAPTAHSLHSHIAAVLPEFAGYGIGTALKEHQRAWSLERGITELTWTFDPAIARNAHLNIAKLGARPFAYLTDFYGPMDDERNRGAATDRLLVRWDLLGAPAVQPPNGLDVPRVVPVPSDIESLRRSDPARATQWQQSLREALASAIDSGEDVSFDRNRGYLISPGRSTRS